MEDDKITVRAFIAVRISEDVRVALKRRQSRLKGTGIRAKWANPETMHMTLAFLGDILRTSISDIANSIDECVADMKRFRFCVAGTGAFGGKRGPRVIWADVHEGRDELMQLQARIADAIRNIGIPLDTRPFTPHLTLARIRSPRGVDDLLKSLALEEDTAFGTVECSEVLLFQSILHPTGPEHIVLHRAPLPNGWCRQRGANREDAAETV